MIASMILGIIFAAFFVSAYVVFQKYFRRAPQDKLPPAYPNTPRELHGNDPYGHARALTAGELSEHHARQRRDPRR